MTPDQRAHLRALAERVRTEEPSDELRDAVLIAMGWTRPAAPTSWVLRDPKGIPKIFPPNPLTSLDAAAEAMPEGWRCRFGWLDDGGTYAYARHPDHEKPVHCIAPTEPHARCAAALLAMAA